MNHSRVSPRTWRITLYVLIGTMVIPILLAILIVTQDVPARDRTLWSGFDDDWSIDSGSIVGDQWRVRPITNSIGLAVHPMGSSSFSFQVRVTTGDPNLATGLIVDAQDDRNFVAFLISSDGYMSLREMRSGEWSDREPWREWPHVRRDGQSNILRVECHVNRCAFFVNDEVTLPDRSFSPSKAIGLIAYPIGPSDRSTAATFDQVRAAALDR